jgi:transcriptional regulator with XRE-family HTH domain
MRVPIQHCTDLGVVIRALRKASGVRQDDLAATVGVSKQFTSDAEHGKPTAQVGLLMRLLEELGGRLEVDVPDQLAPLISSLQQRLHAQDGRHQKRRARNSAAPRANTGGSSPKVPR